jgi:hypothetical protein
MTQQETYEELKQLALELGLVIRHEMGDFDGGLCTIKEQRVVLVNRRHPMGRRIHVVARALHETGLDAIFVKPALRDIIDDELAVALASASENDSTDR